MLYFIVLYCTVQVVYCCVEHGDLHRGEKCYPFTVKQSPGVGRYMVAARDIKQADILNT